MKINPIPYKHPTINLSDVKFAVLFYNFAERGTLMVPEGYLSDVLGHTPSMSTLSVAAVLLKYGCNVSIIDSAVNGYGVNETVDELKKFSPDFVGLSITSADFNLTSKKWIKEIKRETGAKIIVGGELATCYPREVLLSTPEIDYVVIGECDSSLGPLVAAVRDGKPLDGLLGIAYRNDAGEVVVMPTPKAVDELETFPFLPYNLLPYDKYITPQAEYKNYVGGLTQRSCPFRCNYCWEHNPRHVAMSPKRAVDEIEWAHREFDVNEIDFWDPVFNVNRNRVIALCDEIIRRRIKIHFSIHARTDFMDREVLNKLRAAGCIRIQYGVESGDEKVLKAMDRRGKGSLDNTRAVFKMTKRAGISTAAYMVVGLPYQSHESYLASAKFLKGLAVDFTISLPAYIGPGTELYERWMGENNGRDFWAELTLSGEDNATELVKRLPQYLSLEKRLDYMGMYLRAVYFRPQQIINLFATHIWHPFSLLSKARAALQIYKIAGPK